MATSRARSLLFTGLLLGFAGCGGLSVDTPTDLKVTTYPANQPFTMTLTMQACSDVCAEYGEADCSVSVNEDDMVLDVNASISFDRVLSGSECPNRCGPPKFAHCSVPGLAAGVYTVKASSFSRDIVIQ